MYAEYREDAREARPVQPAQTRGAQPQVERARVRPDAARAAGYLAQALGGNATTRDRFGRH